MRFDDQAGAVVEVGGRLKRRVAREEELEFLCRRTCGLAHLHSASDLVWPEFWFQRTAELFELVYAALGEHFQCEHQIWGKMRCEIIEVGFASLRVIQAFGLLLWKFSDFEIGDAEAGLFDGVDDFAKTHIGIRSDENEPSELLLEYLPFCTSNLVRVNSSA